MVLNGSKVRSYRYFYLLPPPQLDAFANQALHMV